MRRACSSTAYRTGTPAGSPCTAAQRVVQRGDRARPLATAAPHVRQLGGGAACARPPIQLPATFRRLVAEGVGESFAAVAVVREQPMVMPGPGEVLVRVHCAGVNGGCETFRVRGEHAFAANRTRPSYPLGAEGAGVVAALGDGVTGLQVGDAVACNGGAAFSEYTLARATMCTRVDAPTPEAVALVLSGVTACAALEGTATIRPGQCVLVTAAAGGTGHFAVQLAKLAGCRVVAVVGSDAKAARLAELGATAPDHVINYQRQDVAAELSSICPEGVDVMYEGVGGQLRASLLPFLAPAGQLLQVGYISEYPHTATAASSAAVGSPGADASESDLGGGVTSEQLFWKGLTVARGAQRIIGSVWPKDPAVIRRCRQRVFDLHAAGQLQALTDLSHGYQGVEQVASAVEYMLRGGHTGKVVVPIAS